MKTKTKFTIVFIILLAGISLIILKNPAPIIDKSKIKTASFIDYPGKFNYRQTINDCGPFNTAAVVRTLKDKEIDSSKFAEEIGWRLPNDYTLPWGLEKQLEENDIVIEAPDLEKLSNEDKILFLQEQISSNKPIIILGGRDNYQHYISIFGFDSSKNEFYIYDSLLDENPDAEGLTIDKNGNLPGNKTITSIELLDFWKNGGMYWMYEWYAIVTST